MNFAFNPLMALGVFASTAATDAAYVFFNAAVSSRRRVLGGALEFDLVYAVGVRSHQLHGKSVLCCVCGDRRLDRRFRLGDVAA